MDFAPPWLTCRCNGQFARSPIRVMLSALHKSTLDQTAADLGVKNHMQPPAYIKRERELVPYSEHWDTSYVLLELGIANKQGCYHQFLASIVFTAFAFEAFLNHVGEHVFSFWPEIEKLAPTAKLLLICEKLEIEPDFSRLPWQIVPKIFGMRNKIAHGKNELLQAERVLGTDTYDRILWDILQADWQTYATQQNAQNAREQVEDLCRRIWDKSSFPQHELFQLAQQTHEVYTKE